MCKDKIKIIRAYDVEVSEDKVRLIAVHHWVEIHLESSVEVARQLALEILEKIGELTSP